MQRQPRNVCWRVGEFLTWKSSPVYWRQSVLVSWFLGFKVSWFLGYLVSWFRSKVSRSQFSRIQNVGPILPNCYFMFSGRYWSHIRYCQKLINYVDGSSIFYSTRLFHNFQQIRFPQFWEFRTYCFWERFGLCFHYLEDLGVSKDK